MLQVAQNDIVTYKKVDILYKHRSWLDKLLMKKPQISEYISLYMAYSYVPNKVHTTKLVPFEESCGHYYSSRGFYSWPVVPPYASNIVKCIIPKGANYYLAYDEVDKVETYISDKIKIVSPLLSNKKLCI